MAKAYQLADQQLIALVARCHSWQEVLRETGAKRASITTLKVRAVQLKLDVSRLAD